MTPPLHPHVPGSGSRFGIISDVAKIPTLEDFIVATHGQGVSLEEIGNLNPDLIFVVDRGVATGSGEQRAHVTLNSPYLNGTNAVQTGRVYALDEVRWYIVGYGLNNFNFMLDQIDNALVNPGIVNIQHAQGSTWVPINPQRAVVFDMGILDSIDALGEGASVAAVPKGNVPSFLAGYGSAGIIDAGTLFEPDLAALDLLNPDIIFVASRSSSVLDAVKDIAPTVDLTVSGTDRIVSFGDQSRSLGKIYNQSASVEQKLADLDAQIESTHTAAQTAGTSLTIMINGGNISGFSGGSRFGLINDELGLKSAKIFETETHGDSITPEEVATINPDMLFVLDRGAAIGENATAHVTINDPVLAQTSAVSSGSVYFLDSERWYIVQNGLNNLPFMVDEIASALIPRA